MTEMAANFQPIAVDLERLRLLKKLETKVPRCRFIFCTSDLCIAVMLMLADGYFCKDAALLVVFVAFFCFRVG